MTLDPTLLPGLLLLLLELLTLAAVGFVVARTVLQQSDARLALAHGLVIGPALWGLTVNFLLHLLPGLAGASLAWALILVLAAALARRDPNALRLSPRTLAVFLAAVFALLWVALAARQLLKIPDPTLHLGLAAYIRAGGWPPITPWNPDFTLYYHYGVDLLIGLLAPPVGPNLVLVTELLSAYIWTSFALVVITALLYHGGWLPTLVFSPLILTAGAWTLVGQLNKIPNIVQIAFPQDLSITGLGEALGPIYWPETAPQWLSELDGSPSNIWKPGFILTYTLAMILLMNFTLERTPSLMRVLSLSVLVGFLGLLSAEIALLTLGLWIVLIAPPILRSIADRRLSWNNQLRELLGPLVAGIFLAAGGGVLTAVVTGAPRPEVAFSWVDDPWHRQAWGRIESTGDSVALIGIGALSAAIVAILLAWRDRLVLSLAVSTLPLMASAVFIVYKVAPLDITRFDGHARNFALLALLIALATRFPAPHPRWRYGASILIVAFAVWPTVAQPVRTIGLGVSRGLHLTNPTPGVVASDSHPWTYDLRRFVIETPISSSVSGYIRDNTPVESRIFSPHPSPLSIITGRPNAIGYVNHLHLLVLPTGGPTYNDVLRYLEPAAVRRLGFDYLHATDRWISDLPSRARGWLNNPQFFELLTRGENDSLLQIKPAFLELDVQPTPESFESLRQSIPDTATIYLAPTLRPVHAVQLAVSMPHAQLRGTLDVDGSHIQTEILISPLGNHTPDFVALPARMAPSAFPPAARQPIWWNEQFAIYESGGSTAPLIPPPPPHFSVQMTDVRGAHDRIAFRANFTDRATHLWTGQDWVVVETDDSPWRLPYRFRTGTYTSAFVRWFDGQVQPVPETDTHEYFFLYEFDPRTGTLALWDGNAYTSLSSPHSQLRPGNWTLAARPNINREEVGLIPVLHFTLAQDGTSTYKVYEGSLDAMLVR